jgi:hypothetical protein
MSILDQPLVPDREMPRRLREASRTLLVDQAAAGRAASRRGPVPVLRRRLVVVTTIFMLALAVALLWPLPANHAFASWAPVPEPLDAPTSAQVGQWCRQTAQDAPTLPPGAGPSGPGGRRRPVLVDRRGDAAVALVLDPAGWVARCMCTPACTRPGWRPDPASAAAEYR